MTVVKSVLMVVLGLVVVVVGCPSQLQLLLSLHSGSDRKCAQSRLSQTLVRLFHRHPVAEVSHSLLPSMAEHGLGLGFCHPADPPFHSGLQAKGGCACE